MTLIARGLLFVAAQAGFVDGPRVLANMAVDSWMPHRFAALSDRLTTQTDRAHGRRRRRWRCSTPGDVGQLVVMYTINVFLTFSLSMFGMAGKIIATHDDAGWRRKAALFLRPRGRCAR